MHLSRLLPALFAGFLAFASPAHASRGIDLKLKGKDGKDQTLPLYRGSYALLIGVSDYTNGWPDLTSIPGELDELERALAAQGFNVVKILDPDSRQLSDAYEDFIDRYGFDRENRLLFFYSGHGFSRTAVEKGYIVPADAPSPLTDERGFARKAIEMEQVLAWARRIESKHALFLFDSCFSGTVFQSRALPKEPPHISAMAARPVRQFISAGSAGEEVPARSVFVPSFIRAIEGEGDLDRDGYITGTELGMYLNRKVTGYQVGQTPQYGKIRDPRLDQGDFVLMAGFQADLGADSAEAGADAADRTSAKDQPLTTLTEKVSYSIGANIGKDFREQGIVLPVPEIVNGVRGVLGGEASLYSPDELENANALFQKEFAKGKVFRGDLGKKIAYAIGRNIGSDFQKQEITIIPEIMGAGIADAFENKKLLLTQEQIDEVVKDFQKVQTARNEEKRKSAGKENLSKGERFLAENGRKPGVRTTASGLQYEILASGAGTPPGLGDKVTVHYEGTLVDGTIFDSSYKRGVPATFPVNGVIPGWTEALQMMRPGSRWKLFIPPGLAYGERGAGPVIGPNAVLVFEVELQKVN